MKNFLLKFITSNKMKALGWSTLNAALLLFVAYISGTGYMWVPFATGALNMITKYINVTYLSKK